VIEEWIGVRCASASRFALAVVQAQHPVIALHVNRCGSVQDDEESRMARAVRPATPADDPQLPNTDSCPIITGA